MTASEARKRRGGSTLVERTKQDPAEAARIDALVCAISLEHAVCAIMEANHVTAAELARRLNAKPPQISRDLKGGLSRATLSRLASIAEALDCDFVPAFVPRSEQVRRRRFFEAYDELISEAPFQTVLQAKANRKVRRKKTGQITKATRRKAA
ncbi:MAG TPA: helix-turn-helix transcriptional regulator [Candidatus Elarobacter sp.]|jgi:transcriptional regulator with XRE-family HTH domain|nr:helix-turn-helix transcriptional regulator [Candidatus Elarobacter sp.]